MTLLKSRIISVIQYVFLLIVSFIAAVPLLSCVLTSLKSEKDLLQQPFFYLPNVVDGVQNYKTVLSGGYYKALIITMIIVLFATTISSLLSAMVAYIVCRFQFKGKKILLVGVSALTFVPAMSMQVYVFKMMSAMHLVNTIYGYILLVSGVDIVSVAIFSRYYGVIPNAIDEAAVLDGCSLGKVFFKIHLPLLKQAFLTTTIIKTIFVYNEYYIVNLYLLNKNKYSTITTLLYSYAAPYGTKYNIICAGVILAILPTTILFLVFQKRIYNGLSTANTNDLGGN
ncbi:carbohydrate ABC transporter permease [Oribacterium sp. P9]|uniref:carbohydrate ABC transporter permease n=1 Tax=Oribacterium sp. P9 TaxID=3378068 RepID=UPI0039679C1C